MKKTLAIVLLVALLVAVLPASALAAKQKVYRVSTKKDSLMVHSVPNDKKETRIGSLPKDRAVIIQKSQGNWKFVKDSKGTIQGWVYGGYLTFGAYATVNTKKTGLNIHRGANTRKDTVIGSAPKGAKVQVQYIQGSLANIIYNTLNGWSARSYLKWVA